MWGFSHHWNWSWGGMPTGLPFETSKHAYTQWYDWTWSMGEGSALGLNGWEGNGGKVWKMSQKWCQSVENATKMVMLKRIFERGGVNIFRISHDLLHTYHNQSVIASKSTDVRGKRVKVSKTQTTHSFEGWFFIITPLSREWRVETWIYRYTHSTPAVAVVCQGYSDGQNCLMECTEPFQIGRGVERHFFEWRTRLYLTRSEIGVVDVNLAGDIVTNYHIRNMYRGG